MERIEFFINDQKFEIKPYSPEAEGNLLNFLREHGFTGAKKVCAEGGCGACSVIVSRWNQNHQKLNHRSITACLVPLATLHHTRITTIEGLSQLSDSELHPVCEAFYYLGASQCGFCTPGFIMSFFARLQSSPEPSKLELERIFDGNLCRCTGYRPIMDAAAIFCCDPIGPDEGLSTEFLQWRKDYLNTKSLDDVFPADWKHQEPAHKFRGEETVWYLPSTVEEALIGDPDKEFVGGNTDLAYKVNDEAHLKVALQNIDELHKIEMNDRQLIIGAGVTVTELVEFLEEVDERSSLTDALLKQCRFFANNQVRNLATIGGGLVNFSNYSDLIPLWVAANGTVTFSMKDRTEERALADFYSGNEFKFSVPEGAILSSISIPLIDKGEHISSYKYARRRMDAITFLSAATYGSWDDTSNTFENVFLVFDGVGAPGFRPLKTEKLFIGKSLGDIDRAEILPVFENELREAFSNRLPERLREYQVRLGKGIILRFLDEIELKQNQKSITTELTERYPNVVHRAQIEFPDHSVGVLGKALPHRNAKDQVTGQAKFTLDRIEANCYHAALVVSPVASGRLLGVDSVEVLKMDGVVGVFSAADVEGDNRFGFRSDDEEVFATELGYCGQPVAVVVATSKKLARSAAKQVKLDIKVSEPILSIDQAIARNSFHGKAEGYHVQQGNVSQVFFDSDLVQVSGEVSVGGQSHFYLETNCAICIPRDDGMMVYSSTQSPSNVVDHISRILGLPKNKVDVQVGRLGGGFGGKQLRAGPIAGICALASHKLNHSVRLSLSREEDMAVNPGRSPFQAKYEAVFSRDGKIHGLKMDFVTNGGFGNDYSADIAETSTLLMDGCYHIPNVDIKGRCAKTNYGPFTSTRGFGKPQSSALIETVLDHGASEIGMDLTELRELNLFRPGDRTVTRTEIKDDVLQKCWQRLKEKSDFVKARKEVEEFNKTHRWKKRGIGVVPSKGNMGFIESDDINRGLAVINIFRDGTVSVNHSGCEMGQGINTRMAQVTAHQLGIPLDSVTVSETQSSIIPNTPPTTMVATDLIGKAIIDACSKLNATLEKFDGEYTERVEKAYVEGVSLTENGVYTAPRLAYDYEKQEGDISYFFVWGVAFTVVEVDLISGSTRIVQSKVVQDCGKSLNPHLDIGQAEGGYLFGIGYYLLEDMIYSDEGKLISNNVAGYKVPSCGDVPLDWDIELLNYAPVDEGLHSSKGIGEANTQLGLSAYFAVKDAVKAARSENGMGENFRMAFPASVDRVSESLPSIEELYRS